jgi:hypothetical protein
VKEKYLDIFPSPENQLGPSYRSWLVAFFSISRPRTRNPGTKANEKLVPKLPFATTGEEAPEIWVIAGLAFEPWMELL